MMRRVTGPECRECSCNAMTEKERFERFGRAFIRYECDHCYCALELPADRPDIEATPDDEVVYRPAVRPVCPHCRSTNNRVIKTEGTLRHHRCIDCKKTFKSREKN